MLIPFQVIRSKYGINPKGVLHIGAHWGEEALDYFTNGVEKTVWVEANPKCMPILAATMPRFLKTLMVNVCLTNEDGEEVTLHISNNEGQSSSILDLAYHKVAHPEVQYIGREEVKTIRLDSLFKEYELNIEDYPFVNIDIQGAELLALKGMGELLHKVKYLYLEVNEKELYKGCPLVSDIEDYIRPFGFERVDMVMAGNFGWGDAFYINRKTT